MTKALIVGGGPAGMIAAIAAAEEGASVTLLEMCIRDRPTAIRWICQKPGQRPGKYRWP